MAATSSIGNHDDFRHHFAYDGNGNVGGHAQFTATVAGDSSNAGVTWTVSSSSSTPGTVDATGKYTAPSVTTGVTASVIATSKTDTTKSASATVTVNAAAAAAVTISPQTAFVGCRASRTIHGDGYGRERDHCHLVGERDRRRERNGRNDRRERELHCARAHADGTAMITATSTADTTKSASASVGIIANGVVTATQNVQVASYTITPPATANVSYSVRSRQHLRPEYLAAAHCRQVADLSPFLSPACG